MNSCLIQHVKRQTVRPVGATPSLCALKYVVTYKIEMKLVGVSVKLLVMCIARLHL